MDRKERMQKEKKDNKTGLRLVSSTVQELVMKGAC